MPSQFIDYVLRENKSRFFLQQADLRREQKLQDSRDLRDQSEQDREAFFAQYHPPQRQLHRPSYDDRYSQTIHEQVPRSTSSDLLPRRNFERPIPDTPLPPFMMSKPITRKFPLPESENDNKNPYDGAYSLQDYTDLKIPEPEPSSSVTTHRRQSEGGMEIIEGEEWYVDFAPFVAGRDNGIDGNDESGDEDYPTDFVPETQPNDAYDPKEERYIGRVYDQVDDPNDFFYDGRSSCWDGGESEDGEVEGQSKEVIDISDNGEDDHPTQSSRNLGCSELQGDDEAERCYTKTNCVQAPWPVESSNIESPSSQASRKRMRSDDEDTSDENQPQKRSFRQATPQARTLQSPNSSNRTPYSGYTPVRSPTPISITEYPQCSRTYFPSNNQTAEQGDGWHDARAEKQQFSAEDVGDGVWVENELHGMNRGRLREAIEMELRSKFEEMIGGIVEGVLGRLGY